MSNTIQIKRRTSGSGTLASLLEGELGVDLTDSNKLYVGTSGGNQLLNPSASTNYLPLTGGTLTGNLNANGLEAGVWSGNASFRGIFHSAHTGTEYCLISNDTNTILSASTGYGVFIRGGNNVSTYQIGVYHNQLPTAGGNTILTTASGLQLSGGTLTNTSQPVLKTAYNADHYLGIGHHYIDLNFSSYTNDLELRTGGTPRLTIHRSTGNATFSGTITATGGDLTGTLNIGNTGDEKIVLKNSNNPYVMFQQGTTNKGYIQWNAAYAFLEIANSAESTNLRLDDTLQLSLDGGSYYDVLTSNTGLLKTGGTLTGDLEVQTASGGELLIDRNGNSGVLLQQKNNGADNSGSLKLQSGTSTVFTAGGTDILTLTSTGGTLTGELTSRKVAPSANNTYSSGGANYRWSNVFSVGGNFSGSIAAKPTAQGIPGVIIGDNTSSFTAPWTSNGTDARLSFVSKNSSGGSGNEFDVNAWLGIPRWSSTGSLFLYGPNTSSGGNELAFQYNSTGWIWYVANTALLRLSPAGTLYPNSAAGVNLGASTNRWNLYATSGDFSGNLTVSGTSTFHGSLDLQDNDKLLLGAGNDLQIYHDGSHSYIKDTGTGSLYIQGGPSVQIENASGANMAVFTSGGAAELYHNNAKKFETTSYGADITGRLVTTSHIDVPDDARIRLGDGDDLQLYHDGSHSYVSDVGTGHLRLTGTNVLIEDGAGTDYIYAAGNAVTLYNAGNIKLQTQSTGVSVTGNLTASGAATVGDSASAAGLVVKRASSQSPYLQFNVGSNREAYIQASPNVFTIGNDNPNDIYFKTNAANNMVLQHSGNLYSHLGGTLGTSASRWSTVYGGAGNFAGSFTINNSGTTSSTFYTDVGNYSSTQVLFEHTGATTPIPFALKKSGYSGTDRAFGILHLDMAHSTVGGGSNVHFTLRNSAGGKQEYAGIGGYILDNTYGSEDGALAFYTTVNGSIRQQKMTLDGTGATIENNLTVNGLTTSNGVRLGRGWHIANRAGIRLDSNGTAYPADILFGHTSAANESSWNGVYWSFSSRGTTSSPQNAFYFYRGSGHASPYNSEQIIMTFTPDLKVGINDTNPSATLDVTGTGNFSSNLTVGGNTTLTNGYLRLEAANSVNWENENTRIVGSNTAQYIRFDVGGTSNVMYATPNTLSIGAGSSHAVGGTPKLYLTGQTNMIVMSQPNVFNNSSYIRHWGTAHFQWQTYNGSNAGILELEPYGGSVGIGTGGNSPSAKLHIGSSFNDAANDLGTAALAIKQTGTSAENGIYIERTGERKGYYIGISGVDGLTFRRNFSGTKSDIMSLTRAGDVGIGTVNPAAQLHIGNGNQTPSNTMGSPGVFIENSGTSNVYTALQVKTGGGLGFVVTNAANVAIGTATPSGKLHVNGAVSDILAKFVDGSDGVDIATRGSNRQQLDFLGSNTSAINAKGSLRINYDSDNNGTNDSIVFGRNGADESGTADLAINEGSVGIGTTSPFTNLTVYGATDSRIALVNSNTGTSSSDGFVLIAEADSDVHFLNREDSDMFFSTNGTKKMTILSGGNVGIGTTSPSEPLEINHSNHEPVLIKSTGNYNSMITMDSNRSSANSYVGGLAGKWNGTQVASIYLRTGSDTTNKDDGYITLLTASSGTLVERIRVQADGNVGIGTASPANKLTITDGATSYTNANVLLQVKRNATNGNDDTSRAAIMLANNSNGFFIAYGGTTDRLRFIDGGDNEVLTLENGGNVGIGTASPSEALHVLSSGSDNGVLFENSNNHGNLWLKAGGNYGCYIRLENAGTANYKHHINLQANGNLYFRPNATGTENNQVVITQNGDLGVGESGPSARLDIASNDGTDHTDSTPDTLLRLRKKFLSSSDKDSAVNFDVSRYITGGNNRPRTRLDFVLSGDVGDTYDNSEPNVNVLSLRSDGRCGINTASPSYPLDIKKSINNNDDTIVNARANWANTGNDKKIGSIQFTAYDEDVNSGADYIAGKIGARASNTWTATSNVNGDLVFETITAGSLTAKARLDHLGNLGVGADPSAKLHVGGSAIVGRTNQTGAYPNDDYDLFVGNGNSGTTILLYNNASNYHSALIKYDANCLKLGLNNNNSADSLLTTTAVNITNTGVGIGSTGPAGLLSLAKGTRTLDIKLETSPATGDMGVQFRAGSGDYLGLAAGGGTGTGIVIDDSNRVGIGTAAPEGIVHIEGGANAPALIVNSTTSSNSARIRIGTGSVGAATDNGAQLIYEGTSTNKFSIRNDGAPNSSIGILTRQSGGAHVEAVLIDSSQRVGIGASPSYTFDVYKSVTGNWLSRIHNIATSGNSSGLLVRMDEPSSTGKALGVNVNGSYKLSVNADGDVDIAERLGVGGAHNNSYQLYVTGVGLITSNLRLGGPSSTAAGNANDPAITVGGYTNAGVYFENSGVGLGAGTNKYLFLDSNGDVDIKNRLGVGGTHSGSYGLYVHGTSYLKENCVLAGNLFFGSTSGSFINQDSFNLRLAGDNGVKLQTYSGGWQDRLVIADDGDINIAQRLGVGGAHSDSYQLYVNGTSRFINAGLFQNNGSGANDHSELNIFKNAGDNTSSAILRVGYDSNSAFVISRQRASSSIYLNSAQSGSTVYHQVNEDTIFTVDGSNVLFYKSAEFDGGIKDKDGQLGSSGQVLKSTGSDVDWDTFDWEDLPNISSLTALP